MKNNPVHPAMPESGLAAELKALKEQAGADKHLFYSEIMLARGRGSTAIVFREPTYEDAEAYIAKQQADPIGANINLAVSLAEGADSKAVVAELSKMPFALSRWIDRAVLPFFGGGAEVTTQAL